MLIRVCSIVIPQALVRFTRHDLNADTGGNELVAHNITGTILGSNCEIEVNMVLGKLENGHWIVLAAVTQRGLDLRSFLKWT